MRILRRALLSVALASFVCLASASATATGASTTTYHGTFSGSVAYADCEGGTPPAKVASGNWNVVQRDKGDAVLTVNIFTNDQHHVSFGAPVAQATLNTGDTFAYQLLTQAGTLTVRLNAGAFTYTISPYSYQGIACESVVYGGSL